VIGGKNHLETAFPPKRVGPVNGGARKIFFARKKVEGVPRFCKKGRNMTVKLPQRGGGILEGGNNNTEE